MRKIKGEMVATKKDYFEAIVKAAQAGVDFGDLDMEGFAQGQLAQLEKGKGKSRKVSDETLAKRAEIDETVYQAVAGMDSAKRVKSIAEVAEMSPQAVTASLKRLVSDGRVTASQFEGVTLYAVA